MTERDWTDGPPEERQESVLAPAEAPEIDEAPDVVEPEPEEPVVEAEAPEEAE